MSQFLRPDSDIQINGWAGSTSPLYQSIDESTISTADNIYADSAASNPYECGLTDGTDPVINTGHVVRYHGVASGSGSPERVSFWLYQGSTLIATISDNYNIARGTWETVVYTLSEAEAATITDYTNLSLRMSGLSLSGADRIYIAWAEMEIPDVPTPGNPEVITHHYKMRRNQ